MRIILGSSSIWRRRIMQELFPTFEVFNPAIDEKSIRDVNPSVLTRRLARAKSEAVQRRVDTPAVIITSDQVVVCRNAVREKPRDSNEVRQWLASYMTGAPARCVTAVYVVNTGTGRDAEAVDIATVCFRNLDGEAIERLAQEQYLSTCAGAFAAGDPRFDHYVGDIFRDGDAGLPGERDEARSSAMGLPKQLTRRLVSSVLGG